MNRTGELLSVCSHVDNDNPDVMRRVDENEVQVYSNSLGQQTVTVTHC